MILDDRLVELLLEAALARVPLEADSAIILEGSLAEGFGNRTSDIDFLVIEEREDESVLLPTLLFAEGRRIEVRVRSSGDVRREVETVLGGVHSGPSGSAAITFDEIDRVQRLAHAHVLRDSPSLAGLRRDLDETRLRHATSAWFRSLARRSTRCSSAMSALLQEAEAARWARTALEQAAKSWLSERGETYIASKWISQQFDRLGGCEDIRSEFFRLASPSRAGVNETEYVTACLSLVARLQADSGLKPDKFPSNATSARLHRYRHITTWQIGERLHVVRRRSNDVYLLDATAARVWRSLDFLGPAAEVVRSVPGVSPEVSGRVIAECHRLGLLGLFSDGEEITVRGQMSAAPLTERPVLSIRGGEEQTGDIGAVRRVPIPADQFAAAGMALVWANAEVENAREDALGALDAGQWGTLEAAARHMMRKASIVILSAYGLVPLSVAGNGGGGLGGTSWQRREDDEEACLRLRSVPSLPSELVCRILELETSTSVNSRTEADDLLRALDETVAWVRQVTAGSLFPSSFVSSREWRETLELCYDWIRMGAYVDSTFPLDEARDVVATGLDART